MPYKSSKPPYREYQPGVGPYSEPQLTRRLADYLVRQNGPEFVGTCTKREPDVLIPNRWAIELKIARPFGDNGKEAEHWSQNLLHPYPGNVSSLSDAIKLRSYRGPEHRAIVVIGYEHSPAQISLDPLVRSFELVAAQVLGLQLSGAEYQNLESLIHPVHQRARVWAWEVQRLDLT